MQEAFDQLMRTLDVAYAELRAMAINQTYLNRETSEYKSALNRFVVAQDNIFRFKILWDDIRKAGEPGL